MDRSAVVERVAIPPFEVPDVSYRALRITGRHHVTGATIAASSAGFHPGHAAWTVVAGCGVIAKRVRPCLDRPLGACHRPTKRRPPGRLRICEHREI